MTTRHTDSASTRRRFLRSGAIALGGVAAGLGASGTAVADEPNFQAGFWGDDSRWGTKVNGPLPEPRNKDSLDRLFFIRHDDQDAPLAEAAPGNQAYNGGRWWSHTVTVEDESAIDFPITSNEELRNLPDGAVTITPGEENHPTFFSCPLLPFKG